MVVMFLGGWKSAFTLSYGKIRIVCRGSTVHINGPHNPLNVITVNDTEKKP